jgi:hypothetical protein
MTGRSEPPHAQLRANLERRVESLQGSQFEKRFNPAHHHHHQQVEVPAGVSAPAALSTEAADPANGTDLGGPGVSPLDINALNNPALVTDANPPTDTNSLGLDIESAPFINTIVLS